MRSAVLLSTSSALLALALLAPSADAQSCSGTTFWKNDGLPNIPTGPLAVNVVPGLCEGEAAGALFDMPGAMPPQRLRYVAVGFGHSSGTAGFQAAVNVEIYQGPVTFNPNGTAVLGTKVFDLNNDVGIDAQISSTAINTIDLLPYNVVVSNDFVVALRMNFNVSYPGCPPGGANANFVTFGSGCTTGKNLLFVLGTGWVDPSDWSVLCPLFYAGNWVIRACTDNAPGPWTNLGGGTPGINGVPALTGSGPLTAGSTMTLDLQQGPPSALALLWLSTSSSPINALGGTVHPFPYLDQVLLATNGSGAINGGISFPGGIPTGTNLYFQWLLADASVIYGITLSNGVRGTTP